MISIVIPCFNVEKFTNLIGLSLIKYQNEFEIIFINDSSKDQTLLAIEATIAKYQLTNCQVVDLPKNLGISEARNVGTAIAKGEWLFFVDGDDIPCLENIRIARDELAKPGHANRDFIRMSYLNFNHHTGEVENYVRPFLHYKKIIGKDDYWFSVQISTWLFRRSFFTKNSIKFHDCLFEDIIFGASLCQTLDDQLYIDLPGTFHRTKRLDSRSHDSFDQTEAKKLHDYCYQTLKDRVPSFRRAFLSFVISYWMYKEKNFPLFQNQLLSLISGKVTLFFKMGMINKWRFLTLLIRGKLKQSPQA